VIPARSVLARAEQQRLAGHENLGFLSERAGFLPCDPPLTALPPTHSAWDRVAADLPDLFRTLAVRRALDAMPVLSAAVGDLPDEFVWRGCALLGMFAHSYVRALPQPPETLPESIERPWAELCRRLHRPTTALTYDDLICYNWRPRDIQHRERRDLEDLELLIPTVGTREERIFYLAQVEVLSRGAPIVGAMVRAQEAAERADLAALQQELVAVIEIIERTGKGFLKIDANPYSPTFVDPVVWAKTVAPFAVAIRESSVAASGTAAPLFQALDVFIGRRRFESRVGREARDLRPGLSPHFRAFLEALEQVSVADFAAQCDSASTKGLWHSLLEAYVGRDGFLAVHRRKVFGFLELAFKVGRSVTIGGFTGLFENQTWDLVHAELETSRLERTEGLSGWCPVAHPASEPRGPLTSPALVHAVLDVSGAGIRCRPGDRLAVTPRNDPDLVGRTLAALRASGEEVVRLDGRWSAAFREQGAPADACTLRELLTLGRIRPLSRPTAKILADFSGSEQLAGIVNARGESRWELWDVLAMLAEHGFDPRTIWRADPWERYSICKLVPPEDARFYSVASAEPGDQPTTDQVELLLSEVRYDSSVEMSRGTSREGTASGFVRRIAGGDHPGIGFPVRVVPAPRFRLPDDDRIPIVMFAGGAGISPFRAFIGSRARQPGPAPALLFLSTRSEQHISLYRAELEPYIRSGWLTFVPAVTRGAGLRTPGSGIAAAIGSHTAALLRLIADGAAVFYVCGAAGFSAAVIDALEATIARSSPGPDPAGHARLIVRRLVASGRLQQDVFTADRGEPAPLPTFDASTVALHNDADHGYWTVIDGGVYDVTEFAHRHPGGLAIVYENSGRDATAAFHTIEHDLDPEIRAMLGLYQIGHIRRLDFGSHWTVAVGRDGLSFFLLSDVFRAWVTMLYRVVEVQNAVRHDFGILDAVTIVGDRADSMTLLKAQLLLEAHQRFLAMYIPSLLGAGFAELWAMTAGLCAPEQDARRVTDRIDDASRSAAAASAAEWLTGSSAQVRALGDADPAAREQAFAGLAKLRGVLEGADMRFLDAVKKLVRDGVRCFEMNPRGVRERSGSALLDALMAIPDALAALHEELSTAIRPGPPRPAADPGRPGSART
jgi:cytochrome b involved in lipid metabolism